MDKNLSPSDIWEEFRKGQQYKKDAKLQDEWEEAEKFYEGNHWPRATPKTKNMPRPVVNICSMICDNKKSGILSGNIKMIYRPSEMFGDSLQRAEEGANIFTKFVENITKEMKQSDLDDLAQDNSVQLGTYIYHYFWDTTIAGGMQTPFVGGVRGEIIHPKNIVFANPMEKDEQKQKYIIIASAEPLSSVKELAKRNGIKEWNDIKADNELEEDNTNTLSLCTVLTKYFRKGGKVYWLKTTKEYYIQKTTAWEPNEKAVRLDDEIDEQEVNEPDLVGIESYFRKQLYPIVVGNHKNRKNCIFGIGEVKQAIPNNKAVNFNLGMMLLSVQNTSWPKIIQKVDALAKQVITNEPGEILTDTTKGSGWGVKYMDSPGFNNQALTLTNTIIDLTRTVTGSTEITNGEALGANMAASAIIALQNQAKKPIEMYQRKFYRTYEKIGKVLEQFFKYFYSDGRLFSYESEGRRYVTSLNGQNYKDIDFSLNIEVGAGGIYSESLTVSLLDNLKNSGDIDTDEYIELYPESIMTFKAKLKKMREQKQQEQLMLQQQAVQQQLTQQNQIL